MKKIILLLTAVLLVSCNNEQIHENQADIQRNKQALVATSRDLDNKIQDNQERIIKNETMIVDNFQAIHDSVAQLRWDIKKFYIPDSTLKIRSDIDSLRKEIEKIKSNIESYYYVEDIKVIEINGPAYTYTWGHNFKDIENNNIQELSFEIGIEVYDTDKEAINRRNSEDVWQGYRTAEFRKEDGHGVYTPTGWAYIFSTPIYGLQIGKFYVISIRAMESGTESGWNASVDPPEEWLSGLSGIRAGKFIITRVK